MLSPYAWSYIGLCKIIVFPQIAGENSDHDDDSESGDSDNPDAEFVCSVSSSTAGNLTDTVYVGTFPPYVKEPQIRSHFSRFAKSIKKVCIQSKENVAYAFITFSSGKVADDAQKILHGSKLMGKHQIKVSTAQPNASSSTRRKRRKRRKTTNVIISNLPPHIKDVDVSKHFANYRQHLVGNPEIKLISKMGVSPHCIAFLSFRSQKVAVAAVEEMNKTKLLQHSIRVQLNKGKAAQHQEQCAAPSVAATCGKPSKKLVDISQKPAAVPQTSIQLTGIPPNLDKEDLVDLLPNLSCLLSCNFLTGNERAAVMKFTSVDSALEALKMFHGKTIFAQTLQAKIHNPCQPGVPSQSSKVANSVTVQVFNLPDNSTVDAISLLFKPFGKIASNVEVIGNCAIIPFSTMEGAKSAVAQCHKTIFNGNVIDVTMETTQSSAQSNCSRVEVSNLPKKWKGSNVCNHFKQFGRIDGIVEVSQGKDKTAPNSAVIDFVDHEGALLALSLDGSLVEGVKLRVVMMEVVEPQLVSTNVASTSASPLSPPLLRSQPTPFHPPSSFLFSQMAATNCVPTKGSGFCLIRNGNTTGSQIKEGRAVPASIPPSLLHSQSTPYQFPSAAHTLPPLSHSQMATGGLFHAQDSGSPLVDCDNAKGHLPINSKTGVSGNTPPSQLHLQSSSFFSPASCLQSDSSPGSHILSLFPPHLTSSTSPASIEYVYMHSANVTNCHEPF